MSPEPVSPGQGRPPRQPWVHDLAVAVHGNVTALSTQAGGVTGDGAEGLYVDDVRVLSRLLVEVGHDAGVPVAAASSGDRSEFLAAARHLGSPGPDPTIELRRRRQLVPGGLLESVLLTSSAAREFDTTIVVTAGGDGCEIGVIKAGRASGALLPVSLSGGVAHWQSGRHHTSISVEPAGEATVARGGAARFVVPVCVPAGGSVEVTVAVTVERTMASSFDAEAWSQAVDWMQGGVVVEAADPRLERLVSASLDDLQHLLLTDPDAPADVFAAAGTPWYLTLFGRDSIWAARLALPFGTALAAGTLRALARRQGTEHDDARAEDPGKIPHELRRTAYVDSSAGFSLPPVYYGTVDATALWICLLHDAWRWGMPQDEVRALLPHLRRAATWLTDVAPGEDGLLKYVDASGTGLVNQGWKDSGDSIRWRDGTVADAPIALVEAQAYAVEAARSAARLLRALGAVGAVEEEEDGGSEPGDRARADALVVFADDLVERLRASFWVGPADRPWLALALDGQGRAVDGVGSNMGHCLGTGALTQEEASSVVATLLEPRMLGAHGIVTFAKDNGGFNPLGYHTGSVWTHDTAICAWGMAREGHDQAASTVARRLLDAGEAFGYRLPELYSDAGVLGAPVPYPASCRPQAWSAASAVVLLTVALGLSVDVPGRTVTVRPPRPSTFGAVTVRGIRVGEARITVAVGGDGTVRVDGLPDDFTLLGD